jgi:polar amino acid transport system substrate-binding protein
MKLSFKQYIAVLFICSEFFILLHQHNIILADNFFDKKPSSSCLLSLGVSNWFPYQTLSAKGVASGKQITLLQQIVREAGCKLSYKSMTFPQGLDALKQGTTDFIMNATPTTDRKEYGLFSIPYRDEFLLLYSTSKYLEKCQNMSLIELLKDGFKLGLQKKLVYGAELTRIQNDPSLNDNIYYIENNVQHLRLVIENELDGIVDDPVVVSYRSTANTTGDALSSCPIVVSSSPISLMFSKKNVPVELVNKINQAIIKIRQSKSYQKNWIL